MHMTERNDSYAYDLYTDGPQPCHAWRNTALPISAHGQIQSRCKGWGVSFTGEGTTVAVNEETGIDTPPLILLLLPMRFASPPRHRIGAPGSPESRSSSTNVSSNQWVVVGERWTIRSVPALAEVG